MGSKPKTQTKKHFSFSNQNPKTNKEDKNPTLSSPKETKKNTDKPKKGEKNPDPKTLFWKP